MTIRKSWILAVLVVIATVFAYSYISKGKKRITKSKGETLKVALVEVVKNKRLPLTIDASGQLKAKNTFDLYSEVTGVLKSERKEFRTGTIYRKGEMMIRIDDTEAKAQLLSQRSDFMNTVTSILPDIKMEFPSEFEKWENYLKDFEIEKSSNRSDKTMVEMLNKKADDAILQGDFKEAMRNLNASLTVMLNQPEVKLNIAAVNTNSTTKNSTLMIVFLTTILNSLKSIKITDA